MSERTIFPNRKAASSLKGSELVEVYGQLLETRRRIRSRAAKQRQAASRTRLIMSRERILGRAEGSEMVLRAVERLIRDLEKGGT